MMRTIGFALIAATLLASGAMLATAVPSVNAASERVEAGILRCTVAGGTRFVFGSSRDLGCVFERADGGAETYIGEIGRFGVDTGATAQSQLVWTVFAPKDAPARALSGAYASLSAHVDDTGLEASALVGGGADAFALQPVSVRSQPGVGIAVGVAELTIRPL